MVAAKALLGGGARPAHVDSRAGLDGQALAALAAAGGKNGLTVASAHAHAEAMGLLTTAIVGLKRPFHGYRPSDLGFDWIWLPGNSRMAWHHFEVKTSSSFTSTRLDRGYWATPWRALPHDIWRRGWDSNPRTAFTINGFRDRPDRPLRHLS